METPWLLTALGKYLKKLYVKILNLVIFAFPRLLYDRFAWILYSYLNIYLLIHSLWTMWFRNRWVKLNRFVRTEVGWRSKKHFGSIILLRSLTNISIEHFSERKRDGCCLSSPFNFYGYLFTDDVGRLCAERKYG